MDEVRNLLTDNDRQAILMEIDPLAQSASFGIDVYKKTLECIIDTLNSRE